MCRYRFVILFSVFFGIAQIAAAQEKLPYSFRHITESDGLLHNHVLSVVQDGKGFIWVATINGLQRYDGSRFIYYPEMLSNPSGIITPGAEMYVDKKDNLVWITNQNSIEKMELGKKSFTVYDQEKLLKDPPYLPVPYKGATSERWLLNRNAVYYYDTVAKRNVLCHLNIFPLNIHQTSFITADSTGNSAWVAAGRQLYLFDKKTETVYSGNFNPFHHPLLQRLLNKADGQFLRFIMIDSRQNIWVTTWGDSLYKYDNYTKKISGWALSAIKTKEEGVKASSTGMLINCMLEDNNHTIWVGTENAGLLRYNDNTHTFDYCVAEEKNRGNIQYNYKIFSLFQDKEQNIWVGTDKGISIFNPYRQYFRSVRHEVNNPLSISKSEIISFIQTSNGTIFIGTWGGGIAEYDRQLNFKKNIFFKGIPEKNLVWSFRQVDAETLWIGCQHGYLLAYNIISGATKVLHPPEIEGSTIRVMESDNKGNIWFGLHNGKIVKWDKEQNKFFPYNSGYKKDIISASVFNIFIDSAQNCWVSTEGGFKQFDLEKRVYTYVWVPEKNNGKALSGKTCQGIEEYDDSTLLIGTIYGGINFFNKKTKAFSHLTIEDGLPSNTIYAIKKDTAGYVWFTTDYNLYKFKPSEKKVILYNIEPGIINSSFVSNKFYALQDGQWLTFTITEAISFLPRNLQYQDKDKTKIEITGFKIFNKPVSIDSVLFENKPVNLSYKENFFTIEFASLHFLNLQQTTYYYRLDGIDIDWVNGGAKRFASYTDLQPGEYIFWVKTDNDMNLSAPASFKIIISSPYWQTWWFKSILVFAGFLILFIFIKSREKNIKEIETEKLKVQQLSAERYKSKLELEQIINYFSSSLIDKNTAEDVLWDVAKNLIGRLGFVDCMIYLWNADKTKMIQKAGFGPKGSIEEINQQPFDVLPGQGVVGYVMQTKEPLLIPDTSEDSRYRPDEMKRLSEITVPLIYNNDLIGIIDSEHPEKNFYTPQHLQVLSTIATLVADKIKSLEAEQLLQQTNIEMYRMNEQLSKAKLEALRAQMNPHFIFNCLTSIDNLIQMDEKEKATLYLSKFAKLIRSILENSTSNVVPCWKDMETLQLYLQLEELRWDKKFSHSVIIADEILNGDYKVPPLVIQPFVENAIHHGLLNKMEGDKKLLIKVSVAGNCIHYLIEDNGVGRAKANSYKQLNKPTHHSMGMQITTDRINLFNQNKNGAITITDLVNESGHAIGTRVEIELINQS